jgi:hypothetical protein
MHHKYNADLKFAKRRRILWRVETLLGNDRETSNYITAFAKKRLRKRQRQTRQ